MTDKTDKAINVEKVIINGEEIILDSKDVKVSEATLNNFLSNFAAKYDYYSRRFALAQRLLHHYEDIYEACYAKKFEFYKEEGGCSDKLAEAKSKANEEVIKAKRNMREMKFRKDLIWSFLRTLDKAHENALNLGYNIRKEMDKIGVNAIKNIRSRSSMGESDEE